MDSYQGVVDKLFELQKFGVKLGLNSTQNLLSRLGDPHLSLACLHLAGTNGKGSVSAMSEAALLDAGVSVGTYTSPHLVRFTERFKINGQEITPQRVMELAEKVWAVTRPSQPPTFFEFITAMAFLLFAEEKVDVVVLETGLGGRLDATNVCSPVAALITNIGLEHQEYLGRTLAAIAGEKAGIIKPGAPLIHGVQQKSARDVVEAIANEKGAAIIRKGRDIKVRRSADGRFHLKGRLWSLPGINTRLVGDHQPGNACLTLGAMEVLCEKGIPVGPENLRHGLESVRWPGRLDKLADQPGRPPIWLDGAHNLPAAKVLARNLDLLKTGQGPLVMVLGIMADKDLKAMLGILTPMADRVILSRPVYQRAADPEKLAQNLPKGIFAELEPDLKRALDRAREAAGPEGSVLITGSLYTVGEAMTILEP